MFETLIDFDRELLLAVNGSDSLFLDRMVRMLTNGLTWIPLYLSLFYMVMKNNDNFRRLLYVLLGAGLCILIAGTLNDEIVKPLVARWRPTHDPQIGTLVDIVDGYRGGKYGFFSSHAANTMSIAVYFIWMVRSRRLSIALVIWLWGVAVGTGVYFLYGRITRGMYTPRNLNPDQYTPGCYRRLDCNWPVGVFVLTLVFVFIKACII